MKPDANTMAWWETQPEAWKHATGEPGRPGVGDAALCRLGGERSPASACFAAAPMIFDGLWMDHYLSDVRRHPGVGWAVQEPADFPRRRRRASTPWPATLRGADYTKWGMQGVPPAWYGHIEHTHRAIDDARGFANVLAQTFRDQRAAAQDRSDRKHLQMKFTLDWLKEHLDTTASAEEIGKALTMVGLEVEEIVDPAEKLGPFVVAHVVEAKPHPNSGPPQPLQGRCRHRHADRCGVRRAQRAHRA